MKPDILVHGNLVLRDRVMTGTLAIGQGRILSIQEDTSPSVHTGVSLIDATGKYILPGAIEVHGHMREPGDSHKEDYQTGTMAAIAGGVTTIFDMPNTKPATTTCPLLDAKIQLATGRAYCDFGIIFGGANNNFDEMKTVDPTLIVGVKFFMAGHETTPTTVTNLGDLYRAFEILGERNLPALVHAENQQLVDHLSSKEKAAGFTDGPAYSRGRGEVVAAVAVWDAINIARITGTELYLCHLSTPGELDALRRAKEHNQSVHGEVAWYHLLFNTSDYSRLGSRLKVSPAIRTLDQQTSLWNSLITENLIDTLCAEHSPHLLSEKTGVFATSASGMPGLQEYRAAILTEFLTRCPETQREAILVKVANLTSTRVAQIFGLTDKGELAPGKSADLVVIDLDRQVEVRRKNLFAKCGWSGIEGRALNGVPELTMLRGRVVYSNGEFVGPPTGQLVTRNF